MAKPTTETRWASEVGANIATPDTTRFDLGWQFQEIPASSWQNYMMNSHGKWIEYLDAEIDSLGFVFETLYFKLSRDLETASDAAIFECTLATNATTGIQQIALPSVERDLFQPQGDPCYFIWCDVAGGLINTSWPSGLKIGYISISNTISNPGGIDGNRYYLKTVSQDISGLKYGYQIMDYAHSAWLGLPSPISFPDNFSAGTYQTV
jgi:hypothetical protein